MHLIGLIAIGKIDSHGSLFNMIALHVSDVFRKVRSLRAPILTNKSGFSSSCSPAVVFTVRISSSVYTFCGKSCEFLCLSKLLIISQ